MSKKVRMIYEFQAEAELELTSYEGEELLLLDDTSYPGWLLVRNANGMEGIVPENYTEAIIAMPTSQPQAQIENIYPTFSNQQFSNWDTQPTTQYNNQPQQATSYSNNTSQMQDLDGLFSNNALPINAPPSINQTQAPALPAQQPNALPIDLGFFETTISSSQTQSYNQQSIYENIPADNNWSSNAGYRADNLFSSTNVSQITSEESTKINSNPTSTTTTTTNTLAYTNRSAYQDDSDFDDEPNYQNTVTSTTGANLANQSNKFNTLSRTSSLSVQSQSNNPNAAIVKPHKPKNAFDAYLFVGSIKPIRDSDKVTTIILDEQGLPQWKRISDAYTISIPEVSSGKKYQGLKQYTNYILKSSLCPYTVSRRYKQFDWLHERLLEKYPNICIPPLPDKAVTGRFEEEFIKKRQIQLEMWLNRMSLHPVVGQSEVLVHFLSCKDSDEKKWKDGKRKYEKDEYRGPQWLCTINVPQISSGTNASVRERIDKFGKTSASMDSCIKNCISSIEKLAYTNTNFYKKELATLGKGFEQLGSCMCTDVNTAANSKLSEALLTTGATYTDIANSYGEQAKHDLNPLLEQFSLYRGIIQQIPDLVSYDKNAIQTVDELQQRPDKQEAHNMNEVISRLDVVNYATLAEINYFHAQKLTDFNIYMKNYLNKQIEFYTDIVEKLKRAASKYDSYPNTSR